MSERKRVSVGFPPDLLDLVDRLTVMLTVEEGRRVPRSKVLAVALAEAIAKREKGAKRA